MTLTHLLSALVGAGASPSVLASPPGISGSAHSVSANWQADKHTFTLTETQARLLTAGLFHVHAPAQSPNVDGLIGRLACMQAFR